MFILGFIISSLPRAGMYVTCKISARSASDLHARARSWSIAPAATERLRLTHSFGAFRWTICIREVQTNNANANALLECSHVAFNFYQCLQVDSPL